ncbi:MAG: DUF5671 domain-containing protein [Candidatus Uhrbacteria bacterium]|nr:DUF5671 domain-containing protein [Candidatus Uhrbacteria bacterium]
MSNDLQPFIKEALTAHIPRAKIKEQLIAAGWQEDEVKNALDAYVDSDFPIPIPKRRPYLSAREAFLYLVLYMSLYVSSFSLGTLFFQFINRWLPDPSRGTYSYESFGSLETIRQATAALIITFPVFMLISWILARSGALDPEKRGSKIRKWLTYITLFIAAGVIIGDLIALVSNVLSGELTMRFVLKILTVLAIAASIFTYYLLDLRKEEKDATIA